MSKLSRGLIIVIIFLLLILHDPFSNSIVSQNYQLYCLAVVSIFESSFFNSPESWFSKSKLILVIPPAYSKFTTADFLNLGEILLIESLKCLEEKVKVFVFSFLSFQTEILLTKHCEDRLWPSSVVLRLSPCPDHTVTTAVSMTAQVAYCSDMDKSVIIANMEKRGWVAVGPEDEWQFYWASTQTCRCVKYLLKYFFAFR